MTQTRTAGLTVELYRTGMKGQILLELRQLGPVQLTDQELVIILKQALTQAERTRDENEGPLR